MHNTPQKILVVDGDEIILRYLPIRFEDCAVLTAKDSHTAMGLLASNPDVSVLLADPQASGYSLLEFCHTQYPRMPQVVVTRGVSAQGPERAKLGHAFRTINKPCREQDLVQALRQALEKAGAEAGPQTPLFNEALEARLAEQTQALRRRADELEAINRMKDELVMIAAHDIRAPLSVILGYTDILLESEPQISANGQSILNRIHLAANRLLSMVNNLLNLAAVEEGKVRLTMTPAKVSSIIANVLEALDGMIKENKIEVSVDVRGPNAEHPLDCGRIEQVLQNLVTNAIKFNRPGGAVRIFAETGELPLRVTVQDTGKGFTEEQAKRAFTKFSRFTGGSNQGSGLGLAIAKAFVTLHGGEITLESNPGEGSTFRFTIVPGYQSGDERPVLPA